MTTDELGSSAMPPHQVFLWRQFLFSFDGRVSRFDYWIRFYLAYCILSVVASLLEKVIGLGTDTVTSDVGWISIVVLLAGTWPALAVAAKRCHDRDRSGWFLLVGLIPLIALWPLVELGFLRGTIGENRFGPDPVAPKSLPESLDVHDI